MENKKIKLRQVKSFVRRNSRVTNGQSTAFETSWPKFGLSLENKAIDFEKTFKRKAKNTLEIGFGSGYSLIEMAKLKPEENFIGIETYKPGIGVLFQSIEKEKLTNIRVYYADAIDIIKACIPDNSLDAIQIFFPDPWRKRRHHKRRLIQVDFINLITNKLINGGELHLATDWEDYALHMMSVLSSINNLKNLSGDKNYSERSSKRPVVTKFEQRGYKSGHKIRELLFCKAQ
ncbi:tRNA (guanosine(46)-N7)-methyltransferase TrmB [Gammaproteobacteria bacterium]|nr:tRNA (guanosine(46)-N7)-methyltransferase TrmB [Gammaproteobacteria bacterium]